ncbi:Testis-specific serine/threonine-protein kinase 2, partial [Lamellibrachia satsuma]
IAILQKLRHRNIAEMLEYHLINGRLCLVMEFCENGNLEQLLSMRPSGFLPEAIARKYFRDMINAIEYIHKLSIVHRDIKCQNFVLDRHDCVKLCDLASARHYRPGDVPFLGSGSAGYQSPEVLESKPCDPRTVDLWAMAVVLFIMLTSKMPF